MDKYFVRIQATLEGGTAFVYTALLKRLELLGYSVEASNRIIITMGTDSIRKMLDKKNPPKIFYRLKRFLWRKLRVI
jgi:hypothetical protein